MDVPKTQQTCLSGVADVVHTVSDGPLEADEAQMHMIYRASELCSCIYDDVENNGINF